MPFTLRQANDNVNPTLAGGVYGKYITLGRPFYWYYDGSQLRFVILISDGGKYGLDSVEELSYNGAPLADWTFHRGILTKQIEPVVFTANNTTNILTSNAHPFDDDDEVKVSVQDGGTLSAPLVRDTKYFVISKTTNTFQLSLTVGGSAIDLTNNGTGTLLVWKADAGFDDADQGLSTYCPQIDTTLSGIAYVDGKLPSGVGSDEPNWENFRIVGLGRRLMQYDDEGNEIGVTPDESPLLGNIALQVADNLIVNQQNEVADIDWSTWYDLYESANVEIWQRIRTDESATSNGLTGRYFSNDNFTGTQKTRLDATVNIPTTAPTTPPITGINGNGFSVVWTGRIKPFYSETHTLKLDVDNEALLYINGELILSATTLGTTTATYTFVEDELYDVEIRYKNIFLDDIANAYRCVFKWSAPSLAEEVVPNARLFPSDEVVLRYGENAMAFPSPTEALEVTDRLMERAVGWSLALIDGKFSFIAPDSPIQFTFEYDKIDDDSEANFVKNTFIRRHRSIKERANFRLASFRNALGFGYPLEWAQADRENLRKYTKGIPSNEPPIEIGVGTRSLAERLLEMEMKLKSDPEDVISLKGFRDSGGLKKGHKVRVEYFDRERQEVCNATCLITVAEKGNRDGSIKYTFIPIPDDPNGFYSDEPVE